MKQPFSDLILKDVETLRRKPACISVKNIPYSFSLSDIKAAQKHLETLYSAGTVYRSFAERILLLNEIY